MKTSEVLSAGLAVLENGKRWHKGSFTGYNENGECYCAMGSYRQALGRYKHDENLTYEAELEANDKIDRADLALEAVLPKECVGIGYFNDDPKTTFADVEALMLKAIEAERDKECES